MTISANDAPPQDHNNSLRAQILKNFATYDGPAAYKPWRPPLRTPMSVDHLLAAGYTPGHMSIPVGMIDLPFKHDQRPWTVELRGTTSSVAIGGKPQSGKTTFLQTLIVAGARTHSPKDLQFFCLDFSAGFLKPLAGLPHVASVATRAEPHRVRRTLAQLTATANFREQMIAEHGLDWDTYLQLRHDPQHPASRDAYSDIVLVIDGWDNFYTDDWLPDDKAQGEHDKYLEQVSSLARRGAGFGLHMAIGLNRWTELRSNIRSSMGIKIDLSPADPNDTGIDATRTVQDIPPNSPGRALSTHAKAFDGEDDAYMHLMIGAPRLDGQDTIEGISQTFPETVTAITEQWANETPLPPKMAMLPSRLSYSDVAARSTQPKPQDPDNLRWSLPVGLTESTLSPLILNVMEDPHVLVFGENDSGKTQTLRTIAKAITDRNTPEQVKFVTIDYDGTLEGAVPDEYMVPSVTLADGTTAHTYITNNQELEKSAELIRGGLEPRRQPANASREDRARHSWWSGPEIVLLCDDWHQVVTQHPASYSALQMELAEHIQSRTSGFHFIASCLSAQMYTMVSLNKGALGVAWTRGGHVLIHSGNKDEYPVKDIPIRKRRPGEALYMQRRQQRDIVQIAQLP